MAQPNMDSMDDYMNMVPKAQSSLQNDAMSSATSSCSITSGTPSTDIRFSEYHLEKMTSRFTPDEDENQIQSHLRTYSVGSKLEHNKRKHHIDRVTAEHANHRVRAFSVGSRVKVPRADLAIRLASQLPASINHQEINNNTNHTSKGKKSSSAPLLNHSKAAHGGSFDPMEDLMEIDYSCKSDDSVNSRQQAVNQTLPMQVPVPTKKTDDYMNMNGRSRNNSNTSNYVDMKPGIKTNEYMDMRPGAAFKYSNSSTSLSSSPVKSNNTPKTSNFRTISSSSNNNNYIDMSPRSYEHKQKHPMSSTSSLSSAKLSSDDYLNMSPVNKSILDGVDVPPKHGSVPDGYMEMTWAASKKNEPTSSSSDEYINMDYSNNNDHSSGSVKDRNISSPIAIQKRFSRGSKSGSAAKETAFPLSSSTTSSTAGGLSPTHSIRPRCDSRDSGIMTPSGSTTIFPFSPGSPMKSFEQESRKCLVDASSGTVKLEETSIEEEPRTPIPAVVPSTAGSGKILHERLDNLSSDYAVMNLGEPQPKKPNLNHSYKKPKSFLPLSDMSQK